MVQVTGEITSPAVDRTHTEPENLEAGSLPAGTAKNLTIGNYTNTGNVAQTVTVSITNETNCTIQSFGFGEEGASVTLQPGTGSTLAAVVVAASEAPGSDPVPFSFEVDSVWS